MKKLYIVRHTKKEDEDLNQDDYDRELSEDGKTEAKNIAENFAKKILKLI